MAQHVYVEVDGRRVDVTALEQFTEYTCDACGQFVAQEQLVTVTLSISIPAVPGVSMFVQGHASHLSTLIDVRLAAMTREAVE